MPSINVVLAVGSALAAVFKWVWEYTKKMKWEKNKFLLEELEKFHSLESTIAMETILDWNSADITINDRRIKFDDDLLYSSFATYYNQDFTKDQLLLRGLFDDYFDNLTRLIFMAKSGLVDEKNLIMFLGYWIKILNGDRSAKSERLVFQIQNYLRYYSYEALFETLQKEKKRKTIHGPTS